MTEDSKVPRVALLFLTQGTGLELVPCLLTSPGGEFEPIAEEDLAALSPEWYMVFSLVKAHHKIVTSLASLPDAHRKLTCQLLKMGLEVELQARAHEAGA